MDEPLFTQDHCTLVPYRAGGALNAGRKEVGSVIVAGHELIILSRGDVVDRAPVPGIRIDTPAVQRALGASTFVQMNDHRWTIDFGLAGRLDRPPKRGPIAAMKFARARNQEFTDLLRQGGATSSSSPNSSSTWGRVRNCTRPRACCMAACRPVAAGSSLASRWWMKT